MTNAPENYEAYVLPDDVEKLEYTPDPKLQNTGTFKLEREDHSLGNMLRMQLLDDERVIFVGYRNPHPLEHHIVLRVQTTKGYSPKQALATAVQCLSSEFTAIMQGLEQNKQLLGGYG